MMTLKEAYESDMPYRHITHRSWYERGNPAPMNVEMAIDSNWEVNCDRNQTYVENRREVMALKQQIDLGLKRESELATKLGKLHALYDEKKRDWVYIHELFAIAEKALESIVDRYFDLPVDQRFEKRAKESKESLIAREALDKIKPKAR